MANDILVKVGADITDFSRKMAESNQALRNFGKANTETFSAFQKVGGALTKSITAPAIAATTALTGITLVKGFQRLVGIDTARAKLSALGHDAESVEEIMNNALESVRGTSFGMDEAATAAASAVAAGIEPGKELTKYLSTMGDAAAIAGTDFNEMASIFNKVQTAQRAYTGDLNQLADRGIPIYQWLAEEAGTSAEAIRDMASRGEVSSEMFRSAIEKNIGGAAKEIGEKSFMAALKNIGADIGRIGANFLDAGGKGEGFFSRLKPLLTEFRGFLQSLEEPAAELGKKFGDLFVKVVEGVKTAVGWFTRLSPVMQKIVGGFTAFAAIAAVAAGPILLFVGYIPNIISGFSAIMTVVKAVGLVFSGISIPVLAAIAVIAAAAAAIYIYWEPIKEFFINLWEGIKEVTLQVWENITEGLSNAKDNILEAWESLKEFFSNFWEGIVETWSETIETIQEIWNGLLEFFTGLWDGIKEIFTSSGEEIGNIVQIALDKVVEIFQTVYDFLNQITGGKFGEMVALIQSALTTAWEIVQHIWDYIKQTFENVLQFLKGLVTGDFGMMKDAINNQMSSARDLLSNIWSTIKSNIGAKLKEILTDLTSKFTEMVSTATNKANEILSAITSVFSSILSAIVEYLTNAVILVGQFIGQMPGKVIEFTGQMMSAGMGLIQGLISGIKNMGKQAIDAITGVVDGVVNKAKSLLNINSPSKVFEQIGAWTGEGLVGGILGTVKDAERASDKMVSAIIPKNKEIDLSYATPHGAQATLASAVRGTVDVNNRDERLTGAINSLERRLGDLEVVMDGERVGRIIRPHINDQDAVEAMTRRYFD